MRAIIRAFQKTRQNDYCGTIVGMGRVESRQLRFFDIKINKNPSNDII